MGIENTVYTSIPIPRVFKVRWIFSLKATPLASNVRNGYLRLQNPVYGIIQLDKEIVVAKPISYDKME